jgi:hypothetical protein
MTNNCWGSRMFGHYQALDRALVAKGFPATSAWWVETIRRFLLTGKKQLVIRAGRRAGKSSTMCRLAVCLALWGEHDIPPGDLGIVAFVSTTRDEASQRLRTISAILDALGVAAKPIDFGLEIAARRMGFKCFACSVASVSGPTTIAIVADEVAKWRDVESGINPAREVLASLRPTMATQRHARMFLVSSPWGVDDAHAAAFDAGETDFSTTGYAPTWEANPTLTEADTHALEPDPRTWAREYLASPAEGVSSFTADEIDGITRKTIEPAEKSAHAKHIIGLDVGLRKDRTAIVALRKEQRQTPQGQQDVLVVTEVVHLIPGFLSPVTLEAVAKALADVCRRSPGRVFADMHYFDAVAPMIAERGIKLEQASMAPSSQTPRIVALQRQIASRTIEIPPHVALRKELLNAVLMTHSGGRQTLKAPERNGLHDDILSALLLALDPEATNKLAPADVGRGVLLKIPMSAGGYQTHDSFFVPHTMPRWIRRYANGAERPAAPPPDHKDWEDWVETNLNQGCRPLELEQYAEANGLTFEWQEGRVRMVPKTIV